MCDIMAGRTAWKDAIKLITHKESVEISIVSLHLLHDNNYCLAKREREMCACCYFCDTASRFVILPVTRRVPPLLVCGV